MAEPSPQKDEEVTKEENSFVESGAHTNHSNVLNESPLKEEEAITDTVKESVPEPLETKRTPSPSISNHSQDVGNTDKHDALSTPSSSTENLADNAGNGRESPAPSDPQKHETPSDPHVMKPGGKPGTPDDTHTSGCDDIICHERDPNDIEPEIKKVIIQGYTDDESKKTQQNAVESNELPPPPEPTPQTSVTKSVSKPSSTDPKKTFHFQKPAQAKSAPKDIKQNAVSNSGANKRPTAPVRSVTTAEKKFGVSPKPTAASISAASKRLATPLRPITTERKTATASERKPFAPSASKRTPSSNPRGTPKAPSTAPPRAMSATRPILAKTENSAHVTPTRNKKYENIQGKVNATSNYTPGGGNVKIFHEKPKFNVTSKIGSLQNANHTPGGGQVRIESRKFNFKENAKPKVDAKAEIQSPHVEKKILTQKLEWKASPKVGSLANASHKPAGGDVKIFNQKVKVDAAQSKVGSLENANHKPAGGNVNIKEYKVAGNSSSNSVTSHSTGNSRRSSTTRTRMPGCHDPISPEEALGRN